MKLNLEPYAILFPGQGSQYSGMGKEFYDEFSTAKQIYDEANQFVDFSIHELCFNGPENQLRETVFTQPCLLATSIACYKVLMEMLDKPPSYLCGHSAGEYAALYASGVLNLESAIRLIHQRGKLMSESSDGSMLAVKGLNSEKVFQLCKDAVEEKGILVPANWNSPEQTVISGDSDSIDNAMFLALENDITVIPLPVSGAFHSPLMNNAAQLFENSLKNTIFNKSKIPVVSNVTGLPIYDDNAWISLLKQQIISPVLWEQSIRNLQSKGINTFIEVGPGNVLSKLVKKIIPNALTMNIENQDTLKSTLSMLQKDSVLV